MGKRSRAYWKSLSSWDVLVARAKLDPQVRHENTEALKAVVKIHRPADITRKG